MTEQNTIRISFRDALRFLLRGFVPALMVALIGAAVVYLVSRNPTPVYRATAILLATRPNSGYSDTPNVMEPSQVDPDIYRSAALHGGLLESSLAQVFGQHPTTEELREWRRYVRVRVDEGLISGLIRVEVDHQDPELAANVSNALADALLAWDRDRVGMNVQATVTSLHRSVLMLGTQLVVAEQNGDSVEAQTLRNARDQLLEQLRSAETLRLSAVAMGLLEPFRRAVVDPNPVNDRTVLATAAAFVLLFLLTYVAQFLAAATNPRVRSADDVTRETGREPVVVLPNETLEHEYQAGVERVAIAAKLMQSRHATPATGSLLVVTSPSKPDERSLLALHLARAFARAASNVLVVDADLVHQSASGALPRSTAGATLSELLVRGPGGQTSGSPTGVAGLEFIPVGSKATGLNSVGLSRNLPVLLQEWRQQFDVVIIDTAAVAESADAVALAQEADVVVLASRINTTRLSSLRGAFTDLSERGAAEVITVLTTRGLRQVRPAPAARAGRAKNEAPKSTPEARARVVQRDRRGV